MDIRPTTFPSGSLVLEGRLGIPDDVPNGGVAICHPHPLMRGSMSSALIPSLQRSLVEAGYVALRFNFRGVGRSEGTYDGGRGEIADARAALGEVAGELPPGAPLALAGWSFGGLVALLAALQDDRVTAVAAVAPPVTSPARVDRPDPPAPSRLREWPGRVLLVFGDRDRLAPPAGMPGWAAEAGAQYEEIAGADHFFTGRYDRLAEIVIAFLRAGDTGAIGR